MSKPGQDRQQPFAVDLPRRVFRRRSQPAPLPVGQPGKAELLARMRRFDMLARLAPADLAELATAARVQVFRTGQYIWHEGEQDRQVLLIESGLAKTERRHRGGTKRTYGLYGPGDSMGIYAIWAGMKYPTDAVALNDGMTAILLDSNFLVGFAEGHPDLAAPLLTELGRFTEAFIRKIDIVSAGTVPQRLATLMTMLIERYGVDLATGSARLPIHLTLEHLSEIVDSRVETVARVLGRWKRQGWLAIDAQGWHFGRLDELYALLPVGCRPPSPAG